MPIYNLGLDGPDGEQIIPAHEFPNEMRRDDTFEYDGYTWQVLQVATEQNAKQGEPVKILRCVPA